MRSASHGTAGRHRTRSRPPRGAGETPSPHRGPICSLSGKDGVHVDSGIQLPLDRVHVIGLCCNAQTFLTPANTNLTVRYVG